MKVTRLALSAMIASACFAAQSSAQQTRQTYRSASYGYDTQTEVTPASFRADCDGCGDAACDGGCGDAGCGDAGCGDASCDAACGTGGGCGLGDGCDGGCGMSSCDGIGGGILGGGLFGGAVGDSCLGDPWTLFPNDNCRGIKIGGWSNVGYHSKDTNFSFNDYADRVQLQQQWIYLEKVADGSQGLGLGGRMDYLYGTDGPDTQAFGTRDNSWDNGWDHGRAYGHAIPQLYGEVAMGDLSAKVGKFFTIIGNEVVAATGNFFYSRQLTFYNAEPFTHTGVLTSFKVDDCTTLWNGYTMGWDSGFQDNGDMYLSGFSRKLTDDVSLVYASALGRFGENGFGPFLGRATPNAGNERGQIHSFILNTALTDKLSYIAQNDYLFTNDATGTGLRNTFGSIHYLVYSLNDKWGIGSRTEWFNASSETAGIRNADVYNQTFGLNVKPTANLTLRPEVRTIWDKEGVGFNENNKTSLTAFGMDGVFTF